jgi:hypothetical protein
VIDRALRKSAGFVADSGRDAHQDLDSLIDGLDGVDVEPSALGRLDHIVAQHEMPTVGVRNEHALAAGEALRLAQFEEPLDLLVDAADRLHDSTLV